MYLPVKSSLPTSILTLIHTQFFVGLLHLWRMGWSVLMVRHSIIWPRTPVMKATTLRLALIHSGSVLPLESGQMLPSHARVRTYSNITCDSDCTINISCFNVQMLFEFSVRSSQVVFIRFWGYISVCTTSNYSVTTK